jgi:hypothetical protein
MNKAAHALATPARICVATRTVHPQFFLQDFKPVAHPETGKPWWMPAKLSLPSPSKPDGKVHKDQSKARAGYMLNSQELIQHIGASRSRVYQGYRRLYTSQTRSDLMSIGKNAVWREDMDELVLRLMRERVVRELAYLAQLSKDGARGYVVPLESWEAARRYESGCILWDSSNENTDGTIGAEADANESALDAGVAALADCSAYKGKLPIFDVRYLLGGEQWDKLRNETELLLGSKVFWLGRQRSLGVQLLLWKLHGYIINDVQEGAAAENAEPQPLVLTRRRSEYNVGGPDVIDESENNGQHMLQPDDSSSSQDTQESSIAPRDAEVG